jgi:hypothetical protein
MVSDCVLVVAQDHSVAFDPVNQSVGSCAEFLGMCAAHSGIVVLLVQSVILYPLLNVVEVNCVTNLKARLHAIGHLK